MGCCCCEGLLSKLHYILKSTHCLLYTVRNTAIKQIQGILTSTVYQQSRNLSNLSYLLPSIYKMSRLGNDPSGDTNNNNNNNSPSRSGGGNGGLATLLNQPIVMDIGTGSIKAGFAGGSKPKVLVGTKIGRPKHTRVMPGGALEQQQQQQETASSIFVGSKLDEHRGAFLLDYPMHHGHVVRGGWNAMEHILEHVYSKAHLNAKADDHPLLLTESPLNPRANREQMAQLFFETFTTPALFVAPPAILSLYASGRTTGVVLDVGEGLTHCIPVYEGYALPHSISRSDIAGRDVTRQLQLLLRRTGVAFTTTAESDFVKKMKEDVCFVTPKSTSPTSNTSTSNNTSNVSGDAVEAAKTLDNNSTTSSSPYQLPDGHVIHISSERYQAPEILFNPMLIGSEEPGVADALLFSIQKSDLDLRATLYSQIVLAGGSTCIPGFGERLLAELRTKVPANTRLRISAPPERMYSAWTGGSILASLATFKNMWVTKSEWDECGSSILHRGGL